LFWGIEYVKNIQNYFATELGKEITYQDALIELYKGEFTTASANHSGEGIFFRSKVADNSN
jgi:hypothetical protein